MERLKPYMEPVDFQAIAQDAMLTWQKLVYHYGYIPEHKKIQQLSEKLKDICSLAQDINTTSQITHNAQAKQNRTDGLP